MRKDEIELLIMKFLVNKGVSDLVAKIIMTKSRVIKVKESGVIIDSMMIGQGEKNLKYENEYLTYQDLCQFLDTQGFDVFIIFDEHKIIPWTQLKKQNEGS